MAEVRRLAAILAADVVGYSRMMGEDEAGTARAVRERRQAAAPILAAHGGRLFKTMGDGMLIDFSSIVSAVECALAMQKLMAERNAEGAEGKSILYRIGVHVGDVLIEGDDLLGDGVNIAARLEEIAEPGDVCVSGAAFEHVRGRIETEFVDLGEKTLKNIARPHLQQISVLCWCYIVDLVVGPLGSSRSMMSSRRSTAARSVRGSQKPTDMVMAVPVELSASMKALGNMIGPTR